MKDEHEDRAGTRGKNQGGVQVIDQARFERLRWRSRRGLLELELLLRPFIAERLPELERELLDQFEQLLECDDVDIHEWLLARNPAPAEVCPVVSAIRSHMALSVRSEW